MALENMEEGIKKPGGAERLNAKLRELWAQIGAMEAAKERNRLRGDAIGNEGESKWVIADQEGLQRLAEVSILTQASIS